MICGRVHATEPKEELTTEQHVGASDLAGSYAHMLTCMRACMHAHTWRHMCVKEE